MLPNTLPKAVWQRMSLNEHITATNTDIMNHPEFSLLFGVVCTGAIEIRDDIPTAATNGRDVYYGKEFCSSLNQKQLRYVNLHEQFHKGFNHCTAYPALTRKYPDECNIAQDYVNNLMIEDIGGSWVERPCEGLLIDPKYRGMSFIEVLQDLIKNPPPTEPQNGQAAKPQNGSTPKTFDKHLDPVDELGADEARKVAEHMEEAMRQGKIRSDELRRRGSRGGGHPLQASMEERDTDWREPMQEFFVEVTAGDEQSRYCPPNRLFLPLDILMPSHFTDAVDEVALCCDTSGSMSSVYPTVFGEIARICQTVSPKSVRVIWWDTKVRGEQVFTPDNYDRIAELIKPAGGGGTTVSCVADYIVAKQYKPQAVVYLTDGYIESDYTLPAAPCLWGVVDNEHFQPRAGKKVNICSINL